ncbi:MAG TPA: hypothetical protein VGE74_04865, partial [Gemmata sp.]
MVRVRDRTGLGGVAGYGCCDYLLEEATGLAAPGTKDTPNRAEARKQNLRVTAERVRKRAERARDLERGWFQSV